MICRKLFYVLILAVFSTVSAQTEKLGSLSLASGYDSLISLKQRNENIFSKEGGWFYRPSGSFTLLGDIYFLSASAESFVVSEFQEYSRIDTDLSPGFSLYNGYWEYTQTFVFHYGLSNFDDLESEIVDISSYSDLFYIHSYSLQSYLSLYLAWNQGIADYIEYASGPSAGLEIGEYYYPGQGNSHMKLGASSRYSSAGKEYDELYTTVDRRAISVTRDNDKQVSDLFFKLALYHKRFSFLGNLQYRHVYRLEKEIRLSAQAGKKKRRIDHQLSMDLEAGRSLGNGISLVFLYGLLNNRSTFDGTAEHMDYNNWNYTRHLFQLTMRWQIEEDS